MELDKAKEKITELEHELAVSNGKHDEGLLSKLD